MTISIETDRLLLRPFSIDDAPALFAVVGNDADMTWDATYRTIEQVTQTVQSRIHHLEVHGFGVWAAIEKTSQTMVGEYGLQMLQDTDEVEWVAHTARRFWRKGLAMEAVNAALVYGFEDLSLPRIVAVIRTHNVAAQHLATVLGFEFVRNNYYYWAEVQYWQMLRENFPGRRGLTKIHNSS